MRDLERKVTCPFGVDITEHVTDSDKQDKELLEAVSRQMYHIMARRISSSSRYKAEILNMRDVLTRPGIPGEDYVKKQIILSLQKSVTN